LSEQVDSTVVNSKLILPEKGNSRVHEVQKDDFGEDLCAINFFFFDFYLLVKHSNSINLLGLAREAAHY
jgi:hypothetical protein